MIMESLLILIFFSEGVIVFLIFQLIDKLSEINFNLEYNCPKSDFKSEKDANFTEVSRVLLDYENTIKQLRKENSKLKHYKKASKTLQRNNQKLSDELSCLKKQYDDLTDKLSVSTEDNDDKNEWNINGVIYE